MSVLDDWDPHQIVFPGDDTPAVYNRVGKHEGAGHHLSTRVRRAPGGETTRVTLGCSCGETVVEIHYPHPGQAEWFLARWPAEG